MNKYIKTDIESAVTLMKTALMNVLHDIDSGEEIEINLGDNISWNLFNDCLIAAGWEELDGWDTNGWEVDFWSYWKSPSKKFVKIQGSLWCGQDYIIKKMNTPILMQSEETRAPWNKKTKKVKVTVSQTLSLNTEIEVPVDFDEFDNRALEEAVKAQIEFPSEAIQNDEWDVDDFCVI